MQYLVRNPNDEETSTAVVQLNKLPQLAAAKSPSFRRDLLLLFAVPSIILTIIFITTDPAIFEYKIAEPTLWGIYTSNLSHRSWKHLGSNLFGLFLIGGLEYLLLTASGYRLHYISVFLGSLLVFPIFGHFFLQFVLINQPVFHSYEAVGFSEPLAAMAGYLPLAMATYQNRVSGLRWPILWALFIYAGGVAFAMSQIFGIKLSTGIIGLLGILGVVGIGMHIFWTDAVESGETRKQYIVTSVFTLLVFGMALRGLFLGDQVGSMVGHLAGFLPGFFVSMIVVWGFSLRKPEHGQSVNLE